jgi:hypothetical protein
LGVDGAPCEEETPAVAGGDVGVDAADDALRTATVELAAGAGLLLAKRRVSAVSTSRFKASSPGAVRLSL